MSSVSSNEIGEGGNTISPSPRQVTPSKRWCFTLNNYTDTEVEFLSSKITEVCFRGFFSKETGSNGNPHLQGYIELKKKGRPLSSLLFGNLVIKPHWEKAKGSLDDNIKYCSKENAFAFSYGDLPEPIYCPEIYGWSLDFYNEVLTKPPDKRKIYWLWESIGNFGKSSFVRYLCIKKKALICSGKLSDLKYLIIKYKEKNGTYPKTILFDVPRTNINYISYQGLEEIKNGCFASTKYECETVVMNYPHLVVFANEGPNTSKLSADRYEIINLRGEANNAENDYDELDDHEDELLEPCE